MAEKIIGTDVNQVEITSLSHIKGQKKSQSFMSPQSLNFSEVRQLFRGL